MVTNWKPIFGIQHPRVLPLATGIQQTTNVGITKWTRLQKKTNGDTSTESLKISTTSQQSSQWKMLIIKQIIRAQKDLVQLMPLCVERCSILPIGLLSHSWSLAHNAHQTLWWGQKDMQAMPAGHHQKLGKGKALIIFRTSRQNSNNSGEKSNGIVNWLDFKVKNYLMI